MADIMVINGEDWTDSQREYTCELAWRVAVRYGADRSCVACEKVVRKLLNGNDEGHSCMLHGTIGATLVIHDENRR